MKKLLAIGLVLALGFSSCILTPIPEPIEGWAYVQAFEYRQVGDDEVKVPLCSNPQILTEAGVNGAITNQVIFKAAVGEDPAELSKTIWIETTLSHWIANGLAHTNGFGVPLSTLGWTYTQHKTSNDGYQVLTFALAGIDQFTLQWREKMLVLPPASLGLGTYNIFKASRFSGDLEVTRLNPNFTGDFVFHVKAMGGDGGWISIPFVPYADPHFTGFKVSFR